MSHWARKELKKPQETGRAFAVAFGQSLLTEVMVFSPKGKKKASESSAFNNLWSLLWICVGIFCFHVIRKRQKLCLGGFFFTWQRNKCHSALISRLSGAVALSQSQSCQNNLAGTPKARPAAYLKTRASSESGWWNDEDYVTASVMAMIYSSWDFCALICFYYSGFLLSFWLSDCGDWGRLGEVDWGD